MTAIPSISSLVHRFLEDGAQRRPEAVLAIHRSSAISYGEVESSANRMAHLLREHGVHKGDRVGLLLPNSIDYLSAYYGALKAGAVAVPLHTGSDVHTIQKLLGNCEAVGVVAQERSAQQIAEAAAGLTALRLVVTPGTALEAGGPPQLVWRGFDELHSFPAAPPDTDIGESDRAMIIYTSGSTGAPRGATLLHRNIAANTRSIVSYLELSAADRVSVVLPFPNVYGSSVLNTHVAVGGSVLLHDSLMFPNAVLDEIEKHSVTGFSGVPSTFALLLNRSNLATRRFSALRYVTQAGGAMPAPHQKRLAEALPNARIFIMYGATEASARLTYLDPGRLADKMGSIGKAIPGVEITIRRRDGSETNVDEAGEIVAQGDNIMEGYWGDPAATAEVLGPHGFHTGDLGRRDAEGFLWVVGRTREMIKSGAHRISPREIEEALLEHGDVDEAAVVGMPDDFLGEAVVAHLTLRSSQASASQDDLIAFCRERLPPHKVPREICIRRALPRNANGKIDKRALREGTA